MTVVTITLPDDLAGQARQAGLLSPEAMVALLREAIKKQRIDRLFAAVDDLTKLEPPLTEPEIQAEIDAARAERRAARNAGGR